MRNYTTREKRSRMQYLSSASVEGTWDSSYYFPKDSFLEEDEDGKRRVLQGTSQLS